MVSGHQQLVGPGPSNVLYSLGVVQGLGLTIRKYESNTGSIRSSSGLYNF